MTELHICVGGDQSGLPVNFVASIRGKFYSAFFRGIFIKYFWSIVFWYGCWDPIMSAVKIRVPVRVIPNQFKGALINWLKILRTVSSSKCMRSPCLNLNFFRGLKKTI